MQAYAAMAAQEAYTAQVRRIAQARYAQAAYAAQMLQAATSMYDAYYTKACNMMPPDVRHAVGDRMMRMQDVRRGSQESDGHPVSAITQVTLSAATAVLHANLTAWHQCHRRGICCFLVACRCSKA